MNEPTPLPTQTIELTAKKYKRQMVGGGIVTLTALGLFILDCFITHHPANWLDLSIAWISVGAFVVGLIWYGVARWLAWWHHG
jgi:hypothetical protein